MNGKISAEFLPDVPVDPGVRTPRSAESQATGKNLRIDIEDIRNARAVDEKRGSSGELISKTFDVDGKVVTLSGDEIAQLAAQG